MSVGPDMTPSQIQELQEALEAQLGDRAWRNMVIVLPPGRVDPPVSGRVILEFVSRGGEVLRWTDVVIVDVDEDGRQICGVTDLRLGVSAGDGDAGLMTVTVTGNACSECGEILRQGCRPYLDKHGDVVTTATRRYHVLRITERDGRPDPA